MKADHSRLIPRKLAGSLEHSIAVCRHVSHYDGIHASDISRARYFRRLRLDYFTVCGPRPASFLNL